MTTQRKNLMTRVPLLALLAIAAFVIVAAVASSGGGESETADDASSSLSEPAVLAEDEADATEELESATFAGDFVRKEGPFSITGDVLVFVDDSGNQILRLTDDFRTNVGGEVVVALRAQDGETVSLGELQSANGEQDYPLAEDTDLTIWDEVLIWDNEADVAFGSAFLTES